MWELAAAFPEQVAEAFTGSSGITGLPNREDIENVVVIGMGGSGISGDVLQAIAAPLLPVPVTVVKGYECPHFVGETSLVFAVSCSGGTEETIEAASDAALAGAKMVVVSSGGELGTLAGAWRAPILHVPPVAWPRAAFGSMAVPLIVVLWRMGFLPGADLWIERAVAQLRHRRDQFVRRTSLRGGSRRPYHRAQRAVGPRRRGGRRRRRSALEDPGQRERQASCLFQHAARAVP